MEEGEHMKYLLVSDTHGELDRLQAVVEAHPEVDGYLHMGDVGFAHPILKQFSIVCGNHDQNKYPKERWIQLGNFHTLMVHGHRFEYVVVEAMQKEEQLWKSWDDCMNLLYEEMVRFGKANQLDLILFGHTHTAFFAQKDGIYLCNPGSLCFSHDGRPPSYAILNVEETLSVQFYFLEEN